MARRPRNFGLGRQVMVFARWLASSGCVSRCDKERRNRVIAGATGHKHVCAKLEKSEKLNSIYRYNAIREYAQDV